MILLEQKKNNHWHNHFGIIAILPQYLSTLLWWSSQKSVFNTFPSNISNFDMIVDKTLDFEQQITAAWIQRFTRWPLHVNHNVLHCLKTGLPMSLSLCSLWKAFRAPKPLYKLEEVESLQSLCLSLVGVCWYPICWNYHPFTNCPMVTLVPPGILNLSM